jgi:hypothetical protein
LRYDGDLRIPDGFSKKEREEIEDTIREFEHQFAFFDEYGEDALKIWKKVNENRGLKKGRYLIKKYRITGSDLSSVKRLIEAYLDDDPERTAKPEIKLEGDRLILESYGFCPLIVTAKIINIDMDFTCPYSTRPYFLAMCRAVNPKVNHKNSKWRAKGDEVCQEIFWIEG